MLGRELSPFLPDAAAQVTSLAHGSNTIDGGGVTATCEYWWRKTIP